MPLRAGGLHWPPERHSLVRSHRSRNGPANSGGSAGRVRHERCAEFPGLYASRLVEPRACRSVASDGLRCGCLQLLARLQRAAHHANHTAILSTDPDDAIRADRRHRPPARRHHPSGTAKSDCDSAVDQSALSALKLRQIRARSCDLRRPGPIPTQAASCSASRYPPARQAPSWSSATPSAHRCPSPPPAWLSGSHPPERVHSQPACPRRSWPCRCRRG